MKKDLTGTTVPADGLEENRSELSKFIDYFLPEECRVKNRSDLYMVGCIAFSCAMFICPPFLIGAIYCYNKAKEGGRE